jgi:hypothetical protein
MTDQPAQRAFVHDPQPQAAPMERGLKAAQPAAAPAAGHPVDRADWRLQHLIDGAEQLLGVAVAAPLRQAASELSTAGYTWQNEAAQLVDQCGRWEQLTTDLRAMIERRDGDIDAARELAARLEEQIANSWLSYYTAQLEQRIRDLIAATPIESLAGNDGEHRRQMYDAVVTRARDAAHAEIAADAKAGKLQPTVDDTPPETAAQQIVATAAPAFYMNRNALGVPVVCDPDMAPDVIELRDQVDGRLLGRIVNVGVPATDEPPF